MSEQKFGLYEVFCNNREFIEAFIKTKVKETVEIQSEMICDYEEQYLTKNSIEKELNSIRGLVEESVIVLLNELNENIKKCLDETLIDVKVTSLQYNPSGKLASINTNTDVSFEVLSL